MKIYIYKKIDHENLTDQHKVLGWFLTMMFREAGERETLTMDEYDFKVLFFGDPYHKVDMDIVSQSGLGKFFSFANIGPRIVIQIKPYMRSKNTNRKAKEGCDKIKIYDELAIKMAIYLHAAVNLMDHWFMDDDINIFHYDDNSRFGRGARNKWTQHERFSFENIMGLYD